MEGNESRRARARRTCGECHRRKIRCDKEIPCSTCVRRGLAEACSRTSSNLVTQEPHTSLDALLNRVAQLEDALESQRSSEPAADQLLLPVDGTRDVEAAHLPDHETISSGSDAGDDVDAPVVLEFLSWGRSKKFVFHSAPENDSGPRKHSLERPRGSLASDLFADAVKKAQINVMEALLPSKEHVLQLVSYHKSTLVWYHGSYSPYTFDNDLRSFYEVYHGGIRHAEMNFQWLALLFSILTGSITCASAAAILTWGFSESEQASLSLNWYNATVKLLNLANFQEHHTIYSVQAISTLTISAHILGLSNSQSVLLASAARIASSLGLNRLGSETKATAVESLRKREAGRRLWAQLCLQDWFSIPFSESYSINPRFCATAKPLNCDDDTMEIKPNSEPTDWSYCILRCEIAALMPELQDSMEAATTLFTRYERVLEFDEKMRKIATASIPTFLQPKSPMSSDWPAYIQWARRSLTICAAHKIIMIHRKFLGLSFTNSAFSFSRRTCIAASKTIIRETQAARDEHGPTLWIDQAFSTASGIILALDAFHLKASDPEFVDRKDLVGQAIRYLRNFPTSSLAMRGIKLLMYLMEELDRPVPTTNRKRLHPDSTAGNDRPAKRVRSFNLAHFTKHISTEIHANSPNTQDNMDTADVAWDAFAELLPPYTGFGDCNLFDDIFNFQT